MASPLSSEVVRVREGGAVAQRIKVETQAIACMLGGADRRTLFALTSASIDPDDCRRTRSARIEREAASGASFFNTSARARTCR